jgi:hypothetical protein
MLRARNFHAAHVHSGCKRMTPRVGNRTEHPACADRRIEETGSISAGVGSEVGHVLVLRACVLVGPGIRRAPQIVAKAAGRLDERRDLRAGHGAQKGSLPLLGARLEETRCPEYGRDLD